MIAAQKLSAVGAGGVLVDRTTYEASRHVVAFESQAPPKPLKVKGRETLVPVFQPLHPEPIRFGLLSGTEDDAAAVAEPAAQNQPSSSSSSSSATALAAGRRNSRPVSGPCILRGLASPGTSG